MRKGILIFALLCCSTRVMAQSCQSLAGQCMNIEANGFQGVISQIDYSPAFSFYQATVQFSDGTDSVMGYCVADHLTFTRVHPGAGAYTQVYSGSFSGLSNVSGTYINWGKPTQHLNWNATVVTCPFPIQACQNDCAKTHCGVGKPPCTKCYAKCLAACSAGKYDDPTCID